MHLLWNHGEQHRYDLEPLLPYYPWRERAKLLEGRAVAAHVGCCVFCVVLCLLVCFIILANQLVEINQDKVQINVNKKPPENNLHIIRCARV